MRKLNIFFLLFISINSFAQIGGNSVYEFLNLSSSARAASLGGDVIAIKDNDLGLCSYNPSLLNNSMSNNLVLDYVNYFTDINYAYVSYAKTYDNIGNFAIGLQSINYGDFIEADENGLITGNFKSSEYALNLFYSRELDSMFSVGANLKPIYSVFDSYTSYGIALDAGITYHNEKKQLTAAFVMKNLGTQIKPYHEGNREPLPFELEIGVSKKLAHAPFRLSFIAHNLETYDLTYSKINTSEPTNVDVSDSNTSDNFDFFGNLMRHTIFGLEFIPTKNFFVRLGYNYQRRKELQVVKATNFVGFSWGFGIKISKFQISYGSATYHLAGASNHFSISTNLSDFYKRKS
ncbi:MAG: type IX secretion system protein PorQ [Bacteroidetes bacterium]|nr:type IX secretion system protein PorQ [Bacteroidota bacterium]